MIYVKSAAQIASMRKAGRILYDTLQLVTANALPGISTKALDQMAEEYILSQGGIPSQKGYPSYSNDKGDFPACICASCNDAVVHGVPNHRPLHEGDLLSVDLCVLYEGYHADSARTIAIGTPSAKAAQLLKVTEECFYEALKKCHEGSRLSDISWAVQSHAQEYGFSVVRALCGHGIGKSMHEDPEVPNFGPPGRGPRLRAGMTIAIEPMINEGGYEVVVDQEDGWTVRTKDGSLSSHYEHTVLITEGEPEMLTIPNQGGKT